jgi:hypothetical protein
MKLYVNLLYVFTASRMKYLNGRGTGCPMLKLGGDCKFVNAILYLGLTDTKG